MPSGELFRSLLLQHAERLSAKWIALKPRAYRVDVTLPGHKQKCTLLEGARQLQALLGRSSGIFAGVASGPVVGQTENPVNGLAGTLRECLVFDDCLGQRKCFSR